MSPNPADGAKDAPRRPAREHGEPDGAVGWARCYRGTRVLVLGAAGFIGRWVARSLGACGARTTLVVRDESAAQRVFAACGIAGEIAVADLLDRGAVQRIVRSARPSVTFNLAGYGVDQSERDGNIAARINVELVRDVCEAVLGYEDPGWAGDRIVHAGSMAEYGPIGGSVSEDRVCAPATPYGKSKLAGTGLLSEYCEKSGLHAVTARIFWAYGPGEHQGRLLPSLIEAAQTHQPVALTAGDQVGDFIYVADVAEGLLRLGARRGKPGEALNLATGRLTSVREFAHVAAHHLGIPDDDLSFGALRPRHSEGIHYTGVDVTRLQDRVSWIPPTDITAGIDRAVSFLRSG